MDGPWTAAPFSLCEPFPGWSWGERHSVEKLCCSKLWLDDMLCLLCRRGTRLFTTSVRGKVIIWFSCCWTKSPTPTSEITYVWNSMITSGHRASWASRRSSPLLLLQDGETPLDIAARLKFNKIVNMLKKTHWQRQSQTDSDWKTHWFTTDLQSPEVF